MLPEECNQGAESKELSISFPLSEDLLVEINNPDRGGLFRTNTFSEYQLIHLISIHIQ